MKDKVYEKVKKYITACGMIQSGDYVIAGISGGADSVCMLYLLKRLQREISFRLAVVHVNHGLRAEAVEDAAFVERICREWELPFYLQEVDMPGYARIHKMSEEEAGRLLRYRAFSQVIEETGGGTAGKIAVAHNANDRAETMLFHMFRGSGLKGLGSIRPVRELIIRPVLCLDRMQIEAYLEEAGLTWRQDLTNGEDTYARNRIRHHILPFAEKEICSKAVFHMGELANILVETEDYLGREAEKLYKKYVEENIIESEGKTRYHATDLKIRLTDFRTEDIVMKKRVLLLAMERLTPHRKDITSRHIESLLELMDKDGSKELSLPYGIRVCKEYDVLFFRRSKETVGDCAGVLAEVEVDVSTLCVGVPIEIDISGIGRFIFVLQELDFSQTPSYFYKKEQNIPENRYTKWFDYDKITTSLLLRTRRTGDYFTIDDELHTQSVKQYMVNQKIPKAKRNEIYLLADESHILWIPGYRASRQYAVGKHTRRILEVRLRGGDDGGANRGVIDGRASQ